MLPVKLADVLAKYATSEWMAAPNHSECDDCHHEKVMHFLGRRCLVCGCSRFIYSKRPMA